MKTKQRENRDNLHHLVFIEVTAQFGELGIPNGREHRLEAERPRSG